MSTKLVVNGLEITGVYDDRFLQFFKILGSPILMRRQTNVEWDGENWVATHIATGIVISRGTNRAQVIQEEITWLEKKLVSHSNYEGGNEGAGSSCSGRPETGS